jgi:cytochrome c-type biogenesis protein
MAQQGVNTPAAPIKGAITMTAQRRWSTFVQGIFFVLGFATFVVGVMGLGTTLLGELFFQYRWVIRIVGGIVLIIFGLFTLKIVNIPVLYSDTRRNLGGVSKGVSSVQSYVTGLSFAAGWTPCIGPFLGAILTLGATSKDPFTSLGLLVAYTLGLGIPFLIVAALADRMLPVLNKLKRRMRMIEIVSGLLLIGIGIAMLGDQIGFLSRILSSTEGLESLLPESLELSIPVAAAAGFLSFVSPCVLPLIPAYLGFIGGWAVNNAGGAKA